MSAMPPTTPAPEEALAAEQQRMLDADLQRARDAMQIPFEDRFVRSHPVDEASDIF